MRFFDFVFQEMLANEPVDYEDEAACEREIAELNAACSDYKSHIEALPSFPEQLREIADPFHVDDALVVRALYEPTKARLKLILRCGNIPDGSSTWSFTTMGLRSRRTISPNWQGQRAGPRQADVIGTMRTAMSSMCFQTAGSSIVFSFTVRGIGSRPMSLCGCSPSRSRFDARR